MDQAQLIDSRLQVQEWLGKMPEAAVLALLQQGNGVDQGPANTIRVWSVVNERTFAVEIYVPSLDKRTKD